MSARKQVLAEIMLVDRMAAMAGTAEVFPSLVVAITAAAVEEVVTVEPEV